jgi:NADH:ubiquinone oxidoreductase subunit K
MTNAFYNIISWVLILTGVMGIFTVTAIVFWLMYEEINK